MQVAKALQLRGRQLVRCPEDRGDASYLGRVVSIGATVHKNHQGQEYIYVTVEMTSGRKSVWPSNRLELV